MFLIVTPPPPHHPAYLIHASHLMVDGISNRLLPVSFLWDYLGQKHPGDGNIYFYFGYRAQF